MAVKNWLYHALEWSLLLYDIGGGLEEAKNSCYHIEVPADELKEFLDLWTDALCRAYNELLYTGQLVFNRQGTARASDTLSGKWVNNRDLEVAILFGDGHLVHKNPYALLAVHSDTF